MASDGETGDKKSDERVFLHDISNHLVVAQGMAGYVHGKLKKEKEEDSKELIRMGKTVKAIESMVEMVRNRREKLRSEAGES